VSTQSNKGSFASMPGRFTAAERDAWTGLLRTHAIMVRRMEEMFQARHQLMYGEFEVLLRLAWAPDHRLRISDLAAASLLTSSGMSRLVDRLRRAGLVSRESAPEDARGAYAALTPAGRERLSAAAVSDNTFVRETFLSLYSEAELEQMGQFWARFLKREAPGASPPAPGASSGADPR
jgi:DNA-binding MarR family transcriptional regulator